MFLKYENYERRNELSHAVRQHRPSNDKGRSAGGDATGDLMSSTETKASIKLSRRLLALGYHTVKWGLPEVCVIVKWGLIAVCVTLIYILREV